MYGCRKAMMDGWMDGWRRRFIVREQGKVNRKIKNKKK
jgi:hypothetical protein